MVQKLKRSDISAELVCLILVHSRILKGIAFEAIERRAEVEKVKREKEEERKEYL